MDAMNALVVTGAAMGISYATARRCLDDGWLVSGVDIDAGSLAAAAERQGEGLEPGGGDVAERAAHERCGEGAERGGRRAGWVNDAGIEIIGRARELREEDLERRVAVNRVGTALGCPAATGRVG